MRIHYDSDKELTKVEFSFEDKYHGQSNLVETVSEVCYLIIKEAAALIAASENGSFVSVYDNILQMIPSGELIKEMFGYDQIIDEEEIEEYMKFCSMYEQLVIDGFHEEMILEKLRRYCPYPETRISEGRIIFELCKDGGETAFLVHSAPVNASKEELDHSVKAANFIVDILFRKAFPKIEHDDEYNCFAFDPKWCE